MVNKIPFRWMVSKVSNLLYVLVYIQEASGKGSLLEININTKTIWQKDPIAEAGYRLVQKFFVTNSIIQNYIEQALEAGWDYLKSDRISFHHIQGKKFFPYRSKEEMLADNRWKNDYPLSDLQYYLVEYNKVHPNWISKWSVYGDPLKFAWQQCQHPLVMTDFLWRLKKSHELIKIMHTYAFPSGKIAEILELPTIHFEESGWERHCRGLNKSLSNYDKMRSIKEDIKTLSEYARNLADIGQFENEMILITDIGPCGDWDTYRKVTSDLVRSITPELPSWNNFLKCL